MAEATMVRPDEGPLQLGPGETLLWQGRPATTPVSRTVLKIVASGLMVVAVGYIVIDNTVGSLPTVPMPAELSNFMFALVLFGVVTLLYGAWLAYTGIQRAVNAGRSVYAVTNTRLLIQAPGHNSNTTSISPADIKYINVMHHGRGRGRGDIIFKTSHPMAENFGLLRPRRMPDFAFLGIDDVDRVEQVVLDLKARMGPSAS